MLSYPFILAVSTAVLTQSKAIGGRVFMAPFNASELAAPNLQQIIADTITGLKRKTYPLSLMLPPTLVGDLAASEWKDYTVQQIFVKQDGRTSSGDIQDNNPMTNQSQHTIVEDWHDMQRVADNYIRALGALRLTATPSFNSMFRLSNAAKQRVVPITRLGNDQLNGVLITYTVSLFEPCTLEDYADGWDAAVVLPTADQHAVHPL
jgi:hypothetical protein